MYINITIIVLYIMIIVLLYAQYTCLLPQINTFILLSTICTHHPQHIFTMVSYHLRHCVLPIRLHTPHLYNSIYEVHCHMNQTLCVHLKYLPQKLQPEMIRAILKKQVITLVISLIYLHQYCYYCIHHIMSILQYTSDKLLTTTT
jgi:hypothetical protein